MGPRPNDATRPRPLASKKDKSSCAPFIARGGEKGSRVDDVGLYGLT
jgi:hypothetical protein